MFNNGDICRVELKGWNDQDPEKQGLDPNRPLKIQWNSRNYVLEVGKPTSLPAEAVIIWFGDPRCMEKVRTFTDENGVLSWIADRATEVRRLRLKYGAGMGDETNFDLSNIPNVEVFDLFNEPILTVLNDPEGESTYAAKVQANNQNDMAAMLKSLTAQVQYLTNQLEQKTEVENEAGLTDEPNDEKGDGIPVDTGNPELPKSRSKSVTLA